jgi:hypothetical protein
MTRLTNAEIGAALGVSAQRVGALARQGMPTDSIEAATAWREARKSVASAPVPTRLDTLDDGTLASTIQRHRHLVATAQGVWEAAMAGGDPNQAKYQTAYNQSLKTLINLEEEQERRALNDKVFIKREVAEATMRSLMGEVVSRLDKIALECAEKCNPDNPPVAVKALEAWVRSTRQQLTELTDEDADAS